MKKLVQAFSDPIAWCYFLLDSITGKSTGAVAGRGRLCKVMEVNVTGVSMGVEQPSREGESKSYGVLSIAGFVTYSSGGH